MPYRHRRRFRNFTIALLALGLAAWIVPSYFSAERYRRRLQTGLEQALHRPVKFGAVSFQLLPRPGFSIADAEVDEDPDFGFEPFARVDRIDCDLRWHTRWRSRLDCVHLRLQHPTFNIVLNSRGEWNVEKLLLQSEVTAPAAAARGQPSSAAEQLDLEVNDARIDFQVGPNKKPFALTDVRASLQMNPAQRRVQFQITASPVRSDLAIPTPGPVEFHGTWTPGADLHGPIDAWLSAQGALLYDWIPVVTGRNPQVYGVIDSRDVHLTGSLPDLTVEGESHVTQLQRWEELPPSDPMPMTVRFRVRLMREGEHLQVESLDALFVDSQFHLSGSVDKLRTSPQLDLVMSLEHSRLEDVLALLRRLWPNGSPWYLKGRIGAMLAIQGPWRDRHYGGFIDARQASLETHSRSFPLSEIAVRINNRGAILSPVQIALAPRMTLSALGVMERTKPRPYYELQLTAKGLALRDAVSFGRALGIHALQGVDATGSANASIHLAGPAWPPARPGLIARAEIRAARLLLPGLTEQLNVPRATLQINGDEITVDPAVAVLGTSVFKAKLVHHGARTNPWIFDLQANSLRLEQAALWFDALGAQRPLRLLERLPGLASFAARRVAASQIFGSLNAAGRFATPALEYRGVTLTDFQGTFEVAGRTIRMKAAKFRADGGRGQAEGTVDFTRSPPLLSSQVSLTGVTLQSFAARLPGPASDLRGSVKATGNFQTRGLTRGELAENLTGQMQLTVRDISFGSFDPLGTLAQQAHWGRLEPSRGTVSSAPTSLNVEIRNRRFILKTTAIDLSGANLQCSGALEWSGALDLNVRADLRRLRRRWLAHVDDPLPPAGFAEVRLDGPIDRLVVSSQDGLANLGKGREGEGAR